MGNVRSDGNGLGHRHVASGMGVIRSHRDWQTSDSGIVRCDCCRRGVYGRGDSWQVRNGRAAGWDARHGSGINRDSSSTIVALLENSISLCNLVSGMQLPSISLSVQDEQGHFQTGKELRVLWGSCKKALWRFWVS